MLKTNDQNDRASNILLLFNFSMNFAIGFGMH